MIMSFENRLNYPFPTAKVTIKLMQVKHFCIFCAIIYANVFKYTAFFALICKSR